MLAKKIALSLIGALLSTLILYLGLATGGIKQAKANNRINTNNGIYVLAMGANTNGLTQANNDAKRFADAMVARFKVPPSNIIFIPNVTRHFFENAIDNVLAKRPYKRKVYVYFSGHGERMSANNRREEGGCYDEALVFSDSKYRDDDFINKLNSIKTTKLITILDTCFSGGMTRASCPKSQAKSPSKVSFCDVARSNLKRLKGLVLTASTENQLAWEEKGRGGLFTQALLNALRFAPPEKNPMAFAFESASRALNSKNLACRQTPQRFGRW